jgi:DNA-binding response OmpR family regulator
VNGVVLSVGNDQELLSLREAVLRTAGFRVLTACNAETALSLVATAEGDVLLPCYSLPVTLRQQLASSFRNRSRNGRIVAITDEPHTQVPVDADAFLYGIEGAEALIDVVSGEVKKQPGPLKFPRRA